ncbi:MAG: DUF3298 domain-containing protein [Lachnospiraceae bacterium]|jgi:hypothetical protein|nr:DUF3298 domain-containing protein [Lachnospiraceae bacterium]
MDSFDRKLKRTAGFESDVLPLAAQNAIRQTLMNLPPAPPFQKPRRIPRSLSAAAAALILFIAIPNFSMQAAAAMKELPVIGSLVDVILLRNYFYEDGYHYADIRMPHIELDAEDNNPVLRQSVQTINDDIQAMARQLIHEFENDVQQIGEEGHTELDVYYETVTNSQDWFTLEVLIYYGSGSGSSQYKYYHIDKTTGQTVQLADLFAEDTDWPEAISLCIMEQMRQQMEEDIAVYWIDGEAAGNDFHSIQKDQNFYFAQNGNLVIRFDEYEVAPGAYGSPLFEIPQEVYEAYLREEFRR